MPAIIEIILRTFPEPNGVWESISVSPPLYISYVIPGGKKRLNIIMGMLFP